MSQRPLKIPGHRPLSRPEDRDRPFSGQRRDPRLGAPARCLSRGRRPGGISLPQVREVVAAREAALRRLQRLSEIHAEARQPFAEVRRELVDTLLRSRACGLEVVEAIVRWRSSSSARASAAWIDPGSGENYLLKMKADTLWLADSPLGDIFRFSPKADPFFVVPSACEKEVTPTNQMTPQLQARRPSKTALPLQALMLKRIRKAELVILEESVHARMAQVSAAGATGAKDVASVPAFPRESARQEDDASKVAEGEATAPIVRGSGSSVKAAATVSEFSELPAVKASVVVSPLRVAALPSPKVEGAFRLVPVSLTEASMQEAFQEYAKRVDQTLMLTFAGWPALEQLSSKSSGAEALEWFWLFRRGFGYDDADDDSSRPASSADGLAVFQLCKQSRCYGNLAHFTLAGVPFDADMYHKALESVKDVMFARLPISSIRTTLWYFQDETGEKKLMPEVNAIFKKVYFKWFQLQNTQDGRRGQVVQRPRATEEIGDPEEPGESPSLQFCIGQVWLRAARSPAWQHATEASATKRVGACAWNLVLASLCFRELWAKDAKAVGAAEAANPLATKAAEDARAGLIRGLLSGQLSHLLSKLKPVGRVADEAAGTNPSAALSLHVARTLEANGGSIPCANCKVSPDNGVGIVKQLISAAGFAEASSGLGIEALPDVVAGMDPHDVAFGRIFLSLDWLTMHPLDDDSFEVPVQIVGRCPNHPHPVIYLATSEEEIFFILIPWSRPAAPPSEEVVFAMSTDILRNTQPMESAPFPAVRLSGFSARSATRTTEISDVESLRFQTGGPVHVCEFSSLLASGGRHMPGRLLRARGSDNAYVVNKPFVVGLWHTDIDNLNVPLCATLVV